MAATAGLARAGKPDDLSEEEWRGVTGELDKTSDAPYWAGMVDRLKKDKGKRLLVISTYRVSVFKKEKKMPLVKDGGLVEIISVTTEGTDQLKIDFGKWDLNIQHPDATGTICTTLFQAMNDCRPGCFPVVGSVEIHPNLRYAPTARQARYGGFVEAYRSYCTVFEVPRSTQEEVMSSILNTRAEQESRKVDFSTLWKDGCATMDNKVRGKVEDAIVEALRYNTWFTTLQARNIQPKDVLVKKLAEIFNTNAALRQLVLCSTHEEKGFMELGIALTCNTACNLTDIDVSRNLIGEKAMERLAQGIANTKCEILNISYTDIKAKSIQTILTNLNASQYVKANLKKLDLSYNKIGGSGTSTLMSGLQAGFPALQQIICMETGVEPDLLAPALTRDYLPRLQLLNLSKNTFTKSRTGAFAQILQGAPLKVLNMSECKMPKDFITETIRAYCGDRTRTDCVLRLNEVAMTPEMTQGLTDGIRDSNNLANLYVADCGLLSDGVIAVVNALKTVPTLRKLYISRNIPAGEDASVAMAQLIELVTTSQLDTLHLEGDQTNNCAIGIDKFFDGIKDRHALTDLNVSGNRSGEEGIMALSQVIVKTTTLATLSCDNNLPTFKAFKELSRSINHNRTIRQYDCSPGDVGVLTPAKGQEVTREMDQMKVAVQRNAFAAQGGQVGGAAVAMNLPPPPADMLAAIPGAKRPAGSAAAPVPTAAAAVARPADEIMDWANTFAGDERIMFFEDEPRLRNGLLLIEIINRLRPRTPLPPKDLHMGDAANGKKIENLNTVFKRLTADKVVGDNVRATDILQGKEDKIRELLAAMKEFYTQPEPEPVVEAPVAKAPPRAEVVNTASVAAKAPARAVSKPKESLDDLMNSMTF